MNRTNIMASVALFLVSQALFTDGFDLSKAVDPTIFDPSKDREFSAKRTSGSSGGTGFAGPPLVIVIASSKARTISPTITYEGSVGGEGCTFLEKLFGSPPKCATTRIAGTAQREVSRVPSGRHANFQIFTVPVGSTMLKMSVAPVAGCGRQNGDNCDVHATSFALSGWMGATAAPGCMRISHFLRNRWEHCYRKWFLGKKRCRYHCNWKQCSTAEFVMRVYSTLEAFTLVEMTADGVTKCESHKTVQFYDI